jgi:hypothetical protein
VVPPIIILGLRLALLVALVVFLGIQLVADRSPVVAIVGIAAAFLAGFYAVKRYRTA